MRFWTLPRYFLALAAFPPAVAAQRASEPSASQASPIPWEKGPIVGKLGSIAQITIPQGYSFTGQAGVQKLLELTQNPTSGDELGAIVANDSSSWFVVFTRRNTGHVKDDEKDQLDAEAMLTGIRRGNERANKIRQDRGWGTLSIDAWARQPFYDPRTNNLTWAIRGTSLDKGQRSEVINYSTRILGRTATMNVDLVLDPTEFGSAVTEFERLIAGYSFVPGHTYAEWREGDPVAEYGLTALVVGGGVAAAAKSGLLGKMWKLIVLVVVGAAATLKNFVRGLFRPRTVQPSAAPPPSNG